MRHRRRAGDRGWVRAVGWTACLALAASLTYTFVRALTDPGSPLDPAFFGLQTAASLLFLVYAVKLGNRVFVAANAVAVLNAAGTLAVAALRG